MIYLTDRAASKIVDILSNRALNPNTAIRFSISGGGCSGFKMGVDLEPPRKFDMASKWDSKFVDKDVRILVDQKSLLFLDGTTVDFEEAKFGHRFTYSNPNVKSWCGCGESFSV